MPTANKEIQTLSVSHQIGLERMSNGEVRELIKILNNSDVDLRRRLTKSLDRIKDKGFDYGKVTRERLADIATLTKRVRGQAYKRVGKQFREKMNGLASHEINFQRNILDKSIGKASVEASFTMPVASQLRSVVKNLPAGNALIKDIFTDISDRDVRRIIGRINVGIVQGKTTPEITRSIFGTKANKFKDGVLNVARRHIDTSVRSAIAINAGAARMSLYQENKDLVPKVRYMLTLSGHPCAICVGLAQEGKNGDGIYPIDEAPQPVLDSHLGCRCVLVPVVSEVGVIGTRASDIGPVPASTTYETWLKGKSKGEQVALLGKERANLFRKGIEFDKMFKGGGEGFVTLKELASHDKLAASLLS